MKKDSEYKLADNTDKKQENRFQKGESGNPSGRPKGSLNKATLALQTLLDDEAETITRKAIELAKDGDITAIRLVLERILPPRKDRTVTFDMAAVEQTQDITKAVAAIIDAVSNGELTPMEGKVLTSLIDDLRRSFETGELEQRILSVEQKLNEEK